MTRGIKIGIVVAGAVVVFPMVAIVALFALFFLFAGISPVKPWPTVRREIRLANQSSLIIDGKARGRSEHGFSQRAGYRPPGSTKIEWFGDVSDGVEPQTYQTGPLVVVIDAPAAQLYVRRVKAGPQQDGSQGVEGSWSNFALIFPNDLGPFPISFYAEKNGLTAEEVSRVDKLGGKRERKFPTTYIESFDPETRDLKCSYHVDNKSSWPLHLRLSEDGTRLALVAIGGSPP